VDRRSIDLNADLGEGCPWDAPLLERISSASVSCGAHAGDDAAIRATLRLARRLDVRVGAHPGYDDREHFGRRERNLPPMAVRDLILTQVEHLALLAAEEGLRIGYVKPHGALYNQAQWQPDLAFAVVNAMQILGVPLVGMPGSVLQAEAARRGVPFVAEGFADRRYTPDGRLVPRGQPGAVLEEPARIEVQVVRLIDEGVQTLCLHGDNPRSVPLADLVRQVLQRRGIAIRPFVTE
jgi:UPF0271 protein